MQSLLLPLPLLLLLLPGVELVLGEVCLSSFEVARMKIIFDPGLVSD